ncbi:hypothetical protein [Maribellus sediminis]|uniref:hypothetical protein n=1 Tax=Maribellus sediminis TaxID=2696285 RepID=UPI0014314E70|nr:hypothetical protein [Maribellus sediminis]
MAVNIMGNKGWIKVHRILLDKPVWKNATSAHKVVLITILLMANHEKNEWEWNGKKFKVSPGQFVSSLRLIAGRCGKNITPRIVRNALERFKKLEFATSTVSSEGRIITILNWDIYQANEQFKYNQVTNLRQSDVKIGSTNNNKKNEKNDSFEHFWNRYDKKVGKKRCLAIWSKLLEEDKAKILAHVPRYVMSKPNKQFRKDPATYLNGEHWLDDVIYNEEVKAQPTKATGIKF